ncbi:MAG TPA: L,D-transpeptidase family protein [Trebonia sp.]|jgi:lipoprotein-anchoring transpeptidase ErfK/SrfK
MNGTVRHVIGMRADPTWRLGMTAVVAAVVAVAAIVAAVFAARPAGSPAPASGPPQAAAPGPVSTSTSAAAGLPGPAGSGSTVGSSGTAGSASTAGSARTSASAGTAASAGPSPVSLVLTAADHRDCPPAATACVDLARHVTWLQAGGKVTFGPVQMEPGKPGGGHVTPVGTFHVSWKAGPAYMSTTYHEAMPWATFFAAGGIAFHGGPLNEWSHGCLHLTVSNAHFYNAHLPVGAEVIVFLAAARGEPRSLRPVSYPGAPPI